MFSFLEYTEDLQLGETDTSIEDTIPQQGLKTMDSSFVDMTEELEFMEMKNSLADAAKKLQLSTIDSRSAETTCGAMPIMLQPFLEISMWKKEATCSRFSEDSSLIAIGTTLGTIEVYNVVNGRLSYMLDMGRKGRHKRPCTSLCFRPTASPELTQNMLVSCDVSGQIHHWHATSEMHLGTIKEPDNEIYTIDFNPTGIKFATSGYDSKVRIYDGLTRVSLQTFSEGNGMTTAGHSNRVFAVKWHPVDTEVILSGGWDNTIQIWDSRVGYSVRSIYGAQIYGDALDMKAGSNRVLTGSWRHSVQLQEWDYGSGQLIGTICWPRLKEDLEPCRLYAALYGRGISHKMIGAGGSGTNETCLFNGDTGQLIACLPNLAQAVYSMSFSPDGALLAVTTTDFVYIIAIDKFLSCSQYLKLEI